ncbi:MAG: Hsp20/alpha crystallin family protein, partial [Gammaproteobacteria bacterium]
MDDTTAVARQEKSRSGAATSAEQDRRVEAALLPPVDVIEDSTGITLRADLPGVPKDKLRLQVDGDTLTIE